MEIRVSYEDGRCILRYWCHICGEEINDAGEAVVAWWMQEGDTAALARGIHKRCLDRFEAPLRAMFGPGMVATEELVDAHFYLGHNARITEAMADEARERCSMLETLG